MVVPGRSGPGWRAGPIPCPLPEHYMLGFDEQKLESEGLPFRFFQGVSTIRERGRPAQLIAAGASRSRRSSGRAERDDYSVYLDGEMQRTGWWYYYLMAWFKVPGGDVVPGRFSGGPGSW